MKLDQHYPPNSIRTYTGKVFDLNNLTPEMICIEDIAHALSRISRFGGHTEKMITVAQHCVQMVSHVPKEDKLAALLHDASEAYIGDMPSPIKRMLSGFRNLEDLIMFNVAAKYGFEYPLSPEVKKADAYFLSYEWDNFVVGKANKSLIWEPEVAKEKFLLTFEYIK